MNEPRRKPTTGRQYPLLISIRGMGSFICPVAQTRLDIARPLIIPSRSTGGNRNVQPHEDSKRQHIGSHGTRYQLSHPSSLDPKNSSSEGGAFSYWATGPPPKLVGNLRFCVLLMGQLCCFRTVQKLSKYIYHDQSYGILRFRKLKIIND